MILNHFCEVYESMNGKFYINIIIYFSSFILLFPWQQ